MLKKMKFLLHGNGNFFLLLENILLQSEGGFIFL